MIAATHRKGGCSELGLLELVRVDRVLEGARALEEGLYIHTFGDQMDVEEVEARHLTHGEGHFHELLGGKAHG